MLVFGGREVKTPAADFAFFLHDMDELEEKKRHIRLSGKDMALLNPNTHTCPVFRTRRDAELTKAIYRRVPVLIDRTRKTRRQSVGHQVRHDVPPDERRGAVPGPRRT